MLTAAGTAVHASCFSSSRIRVTSTTGAEIFVFVSGLQSSFLGFFSSESLSAWHRVWYVH